MITNMKGPLKKPTERKNHRIDGAGYRFRRVRKFHPSVGFLHYELEVKNLLIENIWFTSFLRPILKIGRDSWKTNI